MVRYGLLETRSQVVPLHRVQSVGVTWPLLWRAKGWLHLRLDIAGYAGPQPSDDKRSDRLLPVGDLATARALVWEVLPGVDLAALPTTPPPPRARWLHPFALRVPRRRADHRGVRDPLGAADPGADPGAVRPAAERAGRAGPAAAAAAAWPRSTPTPPAAGPGQARDRDLAEAWALRRAAGRPGPAGPRPGRRRLTPPAADRAPDRTG